MTRGARRYQERTRCPDCGRFVATLVPWHGDGSVSRFVAHGPIVARCDGSRQRPPGMSGTGWPGVVPVYLGADGTPRLGYAYDSDGQPIMPSAVDPEQRAVAEAALAAGR